MLVSVIGVIVIVVSVIDVILTVLIVVILVGHRTVSCRTIKRPTRRKKQLEESYEPAQQQ